MRKHTPGPWKVWKEDGSVVVTRAGMQVAVVDGDSEAEVEANAQLVALAPKLLEALKEMVGVFGLPEDWSMQEEAETVGKAEEVIAEAEGRKTT